ncbi:MAG: hypothetical protein AAGG07_03370 [Planctomycetota bacterium]
MNEEPQDDGASKGDDFYVGYLPVPWGHSRFLRVAVPVALWVFASVAGVLAFSQRDPGEAVWDTSVVREWTGIVRTDPVPFLETDDGPLLIVQVGKIGAQERVSAHADRPAIVRGWSLTRGDRRMIELEPGETAIEPTGPVIEKAATRELAETVSISGEIVDSKCFLGAMKPGNGKGHKACAILCIRGGIPAVVVGTDDAGRTTWAVVYAGSPILPEAWLDRVAEPVELAGRLESVGGLPVLRLDPG